ncbi:MAG: class I SAM-dependent methyltransferase [Deltaproteobacteria bacterium]|nr:class I SAM-dependent methyltransferase [Deltaproteobacteria bacterium]
MNPKRGYQLHLSRGDTVLKNVEGRSRKYQKIISVLKDFRPIKPVSTCLDIGCSSGVITSSLGEHFFRVLGVDIDQEAVQYAKDHFSSPGVQFMLADAMNFPFKENSIDVIICNHIYEHVPQAEQLMEEIYRVLKESGVCYFAAGNKYMVIEGHYGLPFLSWLPKFLADLYLRLTGKGDSYYESHRSLWGLRQLLRRFDIKDYTLPIIRDPEKFFSTDIIHKELSLYGWIRLLAPVLYPWIPTYIWVLTRKRGTP